jgi:hypothetical protein
VGTIPISCSVHFGEMCFRTHKDYEGELDSTRGINEHPYFWTCMITCNRREIDYELRPPLFLPWTSALFCECLGECFGEWDKNWDSTDPNRVEDGKCSEGPEGLIADGYGVFKPKFLRGGRSLRPKREEQKEKVSSRIQLELLVAGRGGPVRADQDSCY